MSLIVCFVLFVLHLSLKYDNCIVRLRTVGHRICFVCSMTILFGNWYVWDEYDNLFVEKHLC